MIRTGSDDLFLRYLFVPCSRLVLWSMWCCDRDWLIQRAADSAVASLFCCCLHSAHQDSPFLAPSIASGTTPTDTVCWSLCCSHSYAPCGCRSQRVPFWPNAAMLSWLHQPHMAYMTCWSASTTCTAARTVRHNESGSHWQ